MHIVLVTITYPPEIRAISFMMQELAEELVLRGHEVTVITSQPKTYLIDELSQKSYKELSVENGIQVIRVQTLLFHKDNYLIRGISEISLPFLFYAKIKKYIKEKIDSIIVYSPPLPLAILGIKVKKRFGAKYLLNIQDIFPQNAIDLGIIKNRFLEKFFERMEKKIYRKADKITAHSEYNRNFLIHKKNVPAKKISSIYNWIDLNLYNQIEKTGALRTRYGLENKFIFLHAGIIGPAQGMDFIIKIAKEVRDMAATAPTAKMIWNGMRAQVNESTSDLSTLLSGLSRLIRPLVELPRSATVFVPQASVKATTMSPRPAGPRCRAVATTKTVPTATLRTRDAKTTSVWPLSRSDQLDHNLIPALLSLMDCRSDA